MADLQNLITTEEKGSVNIENVRDPRHQILIDYRAMNGLITNDDGIRKMKVDELANNLGVVRQTIYDWQESIPNFWEVVNDRRKELSGKSRLARVQETWYLKAVKGEFQHLQLWLANFDPNFRMPTEQVKHELGNSWAALAANKRKVIEGEATDGDSPETNNG